MSCCYDNGSGPVNPVNGNPSGGIPGGIDGVSGGAGGNGIGPGNLSNDTKICQRCLIFWIALGLGAGILIGAKKKK